MIFRRACSSLDPHYHLVSYLVARLTMKWGYGERDVQGLPQDVLGLLSRVGLSWVIPKRSILVNGRISNLFSGAGSCNMLSGHYGEWRDAIGWATNSALCEVGRRTWASQRFIWNKPNG